MSIRAEHVFDNCRFCFRFLHVINFSSPSFSFFFSIASNLFSFPLLVSKLTFLKPHLLCIAQKSSLMNFLYFVRLFLIFLWEGISLHCDPFFTTIMTKKIAWNLYRTRVHFKKFHVGIQFWIFFALQTKQKFCFSRLKTIYFQINSWIIIYIYMSCSH